MMNLRKKIVQPPFLKKGDKVALISPAYWMGEKIMERAAAVLSSWGLEPVIGKHTNDHHSNAYAGDANQRAKDLLWALEDEDIKAIVCSRGGYGCLHLLNRVPLQRYAKNPKWLIGHGDITVLLCAQVAGGAMAINGPMALELAEEEENTDTRLLRDLLFGCVPQYVMPNSPSNHTGHAEGILIGGNLTSYASMANTRFNISGQDCILLLEENEESLHDIDRLFYMLNLEDQLKHVKGIILGDFSSIKQDLVVGSVEQMLTAHLKEHNVPVCCEFPTGSHGSLPLVMGAKVTLDVTEQQSVITFQTKGETKPYQINLEPKLFK